MGLDPECQLRVEEKYLSEEDKKEEKNSQPNKKFFSLKKRYEFLNIRNKGKSLSFKYLIINFHKKKDKRTKIGLTVTKKLGNAVTRNYIKRVIRASVIKNYNKIPDYFDIEIIPKKRFLESNFEEINADINNFFLSLKI